MSPPIDKNDEERLMRVFARMIDERLNPVAKRVDKHSGKFGEIREEVSPAVARRFSESQHEIEDRAHGFERTVLDQLREIRDEMQPRATVELSDGRGGKSIRPASLVAAESSVRTENAAYKIEGTANQIQGQAKALQVGVDRSDAQSLDAAKWSKRSAIVTAIVGTLTAVVIAAWKIYEAMSHASP